MNRSAAPHHELLDLAETALVEGRPEATLEFCRQLLSMEPQHAGARFLEAEALRDLREAPEAEVRYRQVLQSKPDHPEAWSGLGSVMFDQGLMDEAGVCFSRALRLRPDHADAYYGRALVRERAGDEHGARRDYLRAWRLSNRYPVPKPLSNEDVRALLMEAAREAEGPVRSWLAHAPLVILPLPDQSTCEAYDPPASPAELLGHVTLSVPIAGAPLGGLSNFPPAVLLYRRNLERYAEDRAQLAEALRDGVVSQVVDALSDMTIGE